jgi:hypothetical protein
MSCNSCWASRVQFVCCVLSRSLCSSFHTCTWLSLLCPQRSFSAAPELLPVPAVGGIPVAKHYSANSPALGTLAAVSSTSRTFELCTPGCALCFTAASGGWCDASSLGVCQPKIIDKVGQLLVLTQSSVRLLAPLLARPLLIFGSHEPWTSNAQNADESPASLRPPQPQELRLHGVVRIDSPPANDGGRRMPGGVGIHSRCSNARQAAGAAPDTAALRRRC